MNWIFLLFALFAPVAQAPLTLDHGGIVTAAQWNADETQILTAGDDGTIRIWDATTGAVLRTIDAGGAVVGAAWNADSTQILGWTDNGVVSVWDAAGAILYTMQDAQAMSINGARWNADETQILAWGDSGSAYVIMPDPGEAVNLPHETAVLDAEWSGDDQRIITVERSGLAHVFAVDDGTELYAMRFDNEILGLDWGAAEDTLLTWGGRGAAVIWQVTESRQRLVERSLDHSRTFVVGAAWNSDETAVLSWGADETVRLWDADTGDLLFTGMHIDWVTGATSNADETRILSWSFNELKLWDVTTTTAQTFTHDNLVSGAVFNADETRILSWSWDGTARVWPLN